MAESFDEDRFEQIIRRLQIDGAFARSDEDHGNAFDHVKRLIARSNGRLEDIRPSQSIIETSTSYYKVLEIGDYPEALLGDVALAGADAFRKSKHFIVYAPELPTDIEYRILALGHTDYFGQAKLHAGLCTSEMQIARTVDGWERSSGAKPAIKRGDAFYWVAAAKTLCWIFVCLSFYTAIRSRIPNMYLAPMGALPFWLKAFYGTRPLHAGLENALTRIVAANNVVAPIYLVWLLLSLVLDPNAIAYLSGIALSIDAGCFFSPWLARAVVRIERFIPPVVR